MAPIISAGAVDFIFV